MAGRGPQTFQKRQKEQQRKERQQEKVAKRLERRLQAGRPPESDDELALLAAGAQPGESTGEPGLSSVSQPDLSTINE